MGTHTAPRWLRKQRQAREEMARWPQRVVMGTGPDRFRVEALKMAPTGRNAWEVSAWLPTRTS